MISTQQVIEDIIKRTPFLEEILASGLINYSALARKTRPQVEKKLLKTIKNGAIIMALRRLSRDLEKKDLIRKKLSQELEDITIRSNLADLTYANSPTIIHAQEGLINRIKNTNGAFLSISYGTREVTVIASESIEKDIREIFAKEKLLSEFSNLSSVTIKLREETTLTPGVYYTILKLLAWEGINIVEVVSTFTELTIILDKKNIDHAFSILKSYNEQDETA